MPSSLVRPSIALLVLSALCGPAAAQTGVEYLIPAGQSIDVPAAAANDNRTPEGVFRNGAHEVSLSVVRAAWYPEGEGGPGLRVAAIAGADGVPTIPAPLLRVEEGSILRVTVRNDLDDAPIAVFGLQTRPSDTMTEVRVAPGATEVVEFLAGDPGTYMYGAQENPDEEPEGERQQLLGAFVVDPVGGSPPDRIFVMNVFSEPVDTSVTQWGALEALGMNGLSYPFSEKIDLEVGTPVRWRVINATVRNHPMHLHGFYYEVLSLGTALHDDVYAVEDRRLVVTEFMRRFSTMTMEWTPSRPGTWLFHCHLSFHVTAELRLPSSPGAHDDHSGQHMAGLVLGLEVAPGPTDLIAEGPVVTADLYANHWGDEQGYGYGFTIDPDARPGPDDEAPGPLLVYSQYQAVDMTVHNRLPVPTGIHWHGLELEAWADGVPGYSRSSGRVSPAIPPGGSFTYRLSMMRPGTFIYHSHLDDIDQLTSGLFGPLIVLPKGEQFDPTLDHVLVKSWRTPEPRGVADIELNGQQTLPVGHAVVGETHRFRLINIAPAGQASARILRDGELVPIRLLAKDGADLPENQRIMVDEVPIIGVGETADFTWTPTAPGTYTLYVGRIIRTSVPWVWEVTER
jgi:FtsP/CotA-like multicopper oxidase with cupredoxin domain